MIDLPREGVQRRFEVILPETHNIQQKLAFTSMMFAFGWEVKETTPDTSKVTNEAILETSESLFGNEAAGKLANDMLRMYKMAAEGTIYDTRSATDGYGYKYPYRIHFDGEPLIFLRDLGLDNYPNTRTLPEEIHKALAKSKEHEPGYFLPFDVSIVNVHQHWKSPYGYPVYWVKPLEPTIERISGYVGTRMQQATRPKGIVAKMLRTLASATDIEIELSAEDPDKVFMAVETLYELGEQAGLTKAMLRKLRQNIEIIYRCDVLGRPYPIPGLQQNELVFGGESRIGRIDSIAMDSIPSLAKTYNGKTPTIDFLESFET